VNLSEGLCQVWSEEGQSLGGGTTRQRRLLWLLGRSQAWEDLGQEDR
jgi:hypothetical protein